MIQEPSLLLDSLLALPDDERTAMIRELPEEIAQKALFDWALW